LGALEAHSNLVAVVAVVEQNLDLLAPVALVALATEGLERHWHVELG